MAIEEEEQDEDEDEDEDEEEEEEEEDRNEVDENDDKEQEEEVEEEYDDDNTSEDSESAAVIPSTTPNASFDSQSNNGLSIDFPLSPAQRRIQASEQLGLLTSPNDTALMHRKRMRGGSKKLFEEVN